MLETLPCESSARTPAQTGPTGVIYRRSNSGPEHSFWIRPSGYFMTIIIFSRLQISRPRLPGQFIP